MKELEITQEELSEIRMLHAKEDQGMPVSFSANSEEEIWLSPGPGLIRRDDRVFVGNLSKRLVEIARIYISCRTDRERAGGKFFIDWRGAYWKDQDAEPQPFVSWMKDMQPCWTLPERLAERARIQEQKKIENLQVRSDMN